MNALTPLVNPLDLEVGQRVVCDYTVRRWIRNGDKIRSGDRRGSTLGRYNATPQSWNKPLKKWPGEAIVEPFIPGYDVAPPHPPKPNPGRSINVGTPTVRYRRHENAPPIEAMIVGLVWRQEGTIECSPYDSDIPSFHVERRLRLLELLPIRDDIRTKGWLILADPSDIHVIG